MPIVSFTPEITLDTDKIPGAVSIKGMTSKLVYPFTLSNIYPTIPSLDALSSYRKIKEKFRHANRLLHEGSHLRASIDLPPINNSGEALAILWHLFDPTSYLTDELWSDLINPNNIAYEFIFELSEALPFPLSFASTHKLLHTLVWIDTNIKINIEQIAANYQIPNKSIIELVECALVIYCLLIKQQDYWLARSINFNYSMFLQDRIINLIFGDAIYLLDKTKQRQAKLSNFIALELLKGLNSLTLRQLCLASIFMGVIWVNDIAIQNKFQKTPESVLGDIQTQLLSTKHQMAIDNIDNFLSEISVAQTRIVVILDDNGESIFDLGLFQKLLRELDELTVIFVINLFPVSNNISEESLLPILQDSYFSDLMHYMQIGRVQIIYEKQAFRSFERDYLQANTLQQIELSSMLYIKGVNFFETVQLPKKNRYHVFTIYGEMSVTLTGHLEGEGIFVKIPAGDKSFVYHNANQIVTLRHQTENWLRN